MTRFGPFFHAERLKWWKSWMLVTAFLTPICQVGFLCTICWFSEAQVQHFNPGFRFWLEINYLAWNLLTMPVVAVIISDLSWGLEEESNAWDHLFLQPVTLKIHYLVKLVSHASLMLSSQIILAFLLVPVGLILRTNPYLRMGSIPWSVFPKYAAFSILASLPVVAFQTWLSTRFSGLVIGLTAALLGTWACAHLADASPALSLTPWDASAQFVFVLNRSRTIPWDSTLYGLLCTSVLVGLGTFDFVRRKK